MLDLIATQALVERNQAETQKEISRYKTRIENAPTLVKEELAREYAPRIEALQGEIATITQERDKALAMMDKLAVAVLVGVPLKNAPEFASLIQGSNPDEYKASAEHLLHLFRRV
jgi:hypothetical protein